MAQGWLQHFGGDRVEVHSAGTNPQGVHPMAIRVMREVGVDISSHRSKHIQEYSDQHYDVVVTVCDRAREACPSGVRDQAGKLIHMPFEDPDQAAGSAQEQLAVFRQVRDDIGRWAKQCVDDWLAKVGQLPSGGG